MPVKSKVEISQNFVALSEYMNFTDPIFSEGFDGKFEKKLWPSDQIAFDEKY